MLPSTHPLAADPTCLIAALHRVLNRLSDDTFGTTGLSSSQAYALYQIAIEPNRSPSYLANRLSMDASTVTRLIEPFIRRGWVAATASGREKRLSLTDAGQVKVRDVSRLIQIHRDHITGLIGPDHVRVLSGLLLATWGGVVSGIPTK